MGIEVASGFTRKGTVPLDENAFVANLTARDAIPAGVRYRGYMVYVDDENTYYCLKGGITNSHWAEVGSGSGSGGGWRVSWHAPLGDGAVLTEKGGIQCYAFPQSSGLCLMGSVTVPDDFVSGVRPIIKIFSQANSFNRHAWKVTGWLVKPTLQSIDDTSYSHNETTGDLAPGDVVISSNLHLADSDGELGSELIQSGDVLRLKIERVTPVGAEATEDALLYHSLITINGSGS